MDGLRIVHFDEGGLTAGWLIVMTGWLGDSQGILDITAGCLTIYGREQADMAAAARSLQRGEHVVFWVEGHPTRSELAALSRLPAAEHHLMGVCSRLDTHAPDDRGAYRHHCPTAVAVGNAGTAWERWCLCTAGPVNAVHTLVERDARVLPLITGLQPKAIDAVPPDAETRIVVATSIPPGERLVEALGSRTGPTTLVLVTQSGLDEIVVAPALARMSFNGESSVGVVRRLGPEARQIPLQPVR
jgi:hypothetical protein